MLERLVFKEHFVIHENNGFVVTPNYYHEIQLNKTQIQMFLFIKIILLKMEYRGKNEKTKILFSAAIGIVTGNYVNPWIIYDAESSNNNFGSGRK